MAAAISVQLDHERFATSRTYRRALARELVKVGRKDGEVALNVTHRADGRCCSLMSLVDVKVSEA